MIADYERRNFSVSQCKWDGDSTQSIVAILPPSNGTSQGLDGSPEVAPGSSKAKKNPDPIGPIAGGVGGGVVVISAAVLFLLLRRRKKAHQARQKQAKAAAESLPDPVLKPELDGYERIPKIYETAPEVDIDGDGKSFVPSSRAIEIDNSGRNSPVFEMPAKEEVAAEMSGFGDGKPRPEKSEKRKANIVPRPPSPESPASPGLTPTERTRFLEQLHRGSVPASPVSRTVTPATVVSTTVSPTSTLGRGRLEARSPRTATSAVSPNSLMPSDHSPVDELFYNRSSKR